MSDINPLISRGLDSEGITAAELSRRLGKSGRPDRIYRLVNQQFITEELADHICTCMGIIIPHDLPTYRRKLAFLRDTDDSNSLSDYGEGARSSEELKKAVG
jgi:hypothetical protein